MREGNSGQVVVELKLSGKIELPSVTTEWPHRKSVAQGLGERTAIRRTRFRRTRSAASSARPAERAFAAAPRSPEFCLFPAGHSKPRFRPAPRNHPTQREFVLKEIQEGDVMTRSVEELRRESERSRAELAATVDQLRARISDTAEDIRHKVSPQHIKSEVSDYISHKTQSWVEALKQQAMENPMQAIAAGTAVAVPVLRLARGSSLPL